jgi:hypothetical protein
LSLTLVLAALPVLYWEQPADTAAALKRAGIERLRVPAERAAEWKGSGLDATPLTADERTARVTLHPPGVAPRANTASATRRPWVDANGWRFARQPEGRFFATPPAGKAALTAAEAFVHGADLVLAIDPQDLEPLGQAIALFRTLPEGPLPTIADIGVVDDGSFLSGELMNLLARRNLLFRPSARADKDLALTVELGSDAWPASEAANPDALALKVRTKLGDEKRSLRVFGSEVVLARLTGDEGRRRVQLLNYGGRRIDGLRVRLLGAWKPGEAQVLQLGKVAVDALVVEGGATEFSLPVLGPYAVVDLTTAK